MTYPALRLVSFIYLIAAILSTIAPLWVSEWLNDHQLALQALLYMGLTTSQISWGLSLLGLILAINFLYHSQFTQLAIDSADNLRKIREYLDGRSQSNR